MRFAILTAGSRGDVQPLVALGAGLRRAGHEVRVAAPIAFGPLVQGHGLDHVPVRLDPLSLVRSPELQALRRAGPVALIRGLSRVVAPLVAALADDLWQAAQGCDGVILWPAAYGGAAVAEKLGVPVILAYLQPLANPTAAFASYAVPWRRAAPGPFNRLTHWAVREGLWLGVRRPVNAWRRRTLGLAPFGWGSPLGALRRQGSLTLFAYSQHVQPRPADWLPTEQVTGYWWLSGLSGWEPPPDLRAFLAAGPAPVYVGFGSMRDRDPEGLTRLVLTALEMIGQRAVLSAGWAELGTGPLPASVFRVDDLPHDWLLPRMAAAVHHGGAGTVGASLRAGIPTVVVPFVLDQFAWGRRVAALGAGPMPVPAARLTAGRLAAAIDQAVSDRGMRRRAAALGEALRAEDGVARAVALIHCHLGL